MIVHRALAVVAFSALSVVPALAAPINVVNYSFEMLPIGGLSEPCGVGCSYSQLSLIPGWLTPTTVGQFQPGTHAGNFASFNSLSDGITSAYSNEGAITQTVAATVQAGVVYTLLVDIGDRNGLPALGIPRLRVNGTFYDGTGVLVEGGWATYTASYTGLAADAGLAIEIVLSSSSTGAQGNFDNVRLSDSTQVPSPVPEPMTLSLLGVGLAGIGVARRRRA